MGKKGSWFSAIKRVFSSSSNEKQTNGSGRKSTKEKKQQRRVLKHVESRSFIPLFRKPSSIEKILGEADQQKLFISAPTSSELPKIPWSLPAGTKSSRASSPQAVSPRTASPKVASPKATPRAVSPKAVLPKAGPQRFATPRAAATQIASPCNASPVVVQYHGEEKNAIRTEPTVINLHLSATRIQAANRGYMARRSFRALKGLVRLQTVIRGQNVKRQTANAMKKMQLLVRVQNQIQLRRIQMSENQALHHQSYRNDKEVESTLSTLALDQLSDVGNNEDWDDSLLTKEEVDERLRKKVEAILKRERAMAYAYSHQRLWKGNAGSAQTVMDFKSNGFPWWRNWSENQLSIANSSELQSAMKNDHSTSQTPMSKHMPSPRVQGSGYGQQSYAFDSHDSETPRSSKSMVPLRAKQYQTPTRTPSRTPPPNRTRPLKHVGSRVSKGDSPFDAPMNDTDSLTSCPPLSMPNYMAPTASAMAKARPRSNPKEREIGTLRNDDKRRFSFPLTPSIGPFKWNRGSNKDSALEKGVREHHSMRSIGEVSIDSTVSMPALSVRKPFKRFV